MSYHLKVLRDYPIAFYPLDETSGTVLYDISGSGNNGTAGFNYDLDYLPFVPGGKNAKLVGYGYPPDYKTFEITPTKNYSGSDTSDSFFGTYATSDNDFSIEFWVKPNLTTSFLYSGSYRIISDNVGGNLFTNRFEIVIYKNQIVFSVQGNDYNSAEPYGYYEVAANLSFSKKAMHVVAVYSTDSISIYMDGVLAGTTILQKNFKFLGQGIPGVEVKTLKVGTYSSLLFGIDALAIYRYALEPFQILSHYFAGVKQTEPIQIAAPDNGRLFTLNSTKLFETMTYSYPANKSLQSLIGQSVDPIPSHSFAYVSNNKSNSSTAGEYIYYDQASKSLKFIEGSNKTVAFDDFILLPPEIGTTSKIEWRGDFEIRVFTSVDGVNYLECKNNSVIPQYRNGSYDSSGKLYIRTYFEAINPNSSFSFLGISFYNTKRFYSDNSGDYIEPTTNSDYTLGSLNYPVLSHHENNGLRIYDPPSANPGGFTINSTKPISTIELMYTPKQITGYSTCLLSKTGTTNVQLSWDSSGVLTKTGISKIYINGVDKTASTNVSELFKENIAQVVNQYQDYLCHVVITFTQVSGPIYINQKSDGSLPGYDSLFNNIIIYEDELSSQKVLEHFNLIISKPAAIVVDPAITMSENAVNYYNNDWVPVITTQSVT